ncbi:hypothetical protein BKA70DRAFT_1115467 [Coprinopsis sp. MPI-PUGE-AT-0042]|nr:hypothetical protein BKA70DRAFT_1115467 [Coprinopsis sp. MPI-PUGE-AT-0042]
MGNTLDFLRSTYISLQERVDRALLTQVGDAICLGIVVDQVKSFLEHCLQCQDIFPAQELEILRNNINTFVGLLDDAKEQSSDPYCRDPAPVLVEVWTGRCEWPRKEIKKEFLAQALVHRGPCKVAAAISSLKIGCSSHTVQQEALRHGLVEPCQPVLQTIHHLDGSLEDCWIATWPPMSPLNDDPQALNKEIQALLQTFPQIGCQMIAGALASTGHRVSRKMIEASYLRIRGVPGHMVTGIEVSSNNRADTVLQVFQGMSACIRKFSSHYLPEAAHHHGLPSCIRGDHGTENTLVAAYMFDT